MGIVKWLSGVFRSSSDRRARVDRSLAKRDPKDPSRWDVESIRVDQSTGNATFGDRNLG